MKELIIELIKDYKSDLTKNEKELIRLHKKGECVKEVLEKCVGLKRMLESAYIELSKYIKDVK